MCWRGGPLSLLTAVPSPVLFPADELSEALPSASVAAASVLVSETCHARCIFFGVTFKMSINPTLPETNTHTHTHTVKVLISGTCIDAMLAAFCRLHC